MDYDELEVMEELSTRESSTFAFIVQNTTNIPRRRSRSLFVYKVAVQAVILALAIFGNTCLFLVLQKRRRNFTRMHMFIMHLCFADMLVAFFNTLPQLIWELVGEWKAGDFMCKFIKFMQVYVMYLSTYVLVLTALDRRRAICSPLLSHTWTYRLVHLSVAGVYLLSAVLSIPQAIIFKYQETYPGSGKKNCWVLFEPEWTLQLYVTAFTALVWVLPVFILLYAYGSICYTIFVRYKQSKYLMNKLNNSSSSNIKGFQMKQLNTPFSGGQKSAQNSLVPRSSSFAGFTRAKMKTVKLTAVIIIGYVACWSPFFISQLWWLYDENAPANNKALVVLLLLASLNSCLNPWIYMFFNGTCSSCARSLSKRCFGEGTKTSYDQRTSTYQGFRNTRKSSSVTTTRTQSWPKLMISNQVHDPCT